MTYLVIIIFSLKIYITIFNNIFKIVFAVDRSSAEEKIIETGISDDQYTEVVKGLNKGEKVVVKGYEWLRNRSKVKVMK